MAIARPRLASNLLRRFALRFIKSYSYSILLFAALMMVGSSPGGAQDWFRAGTGLGDTNKPRVAVADFGPRADGAKPHASLFTQVVRDDLQFSGILDFVSPSLYPTTAPTLPNELRNLDWTNAPANANLAPPGHYLLFVLNANGVPSVGTIVQIQ